LGRKDSNLRRPEPTVISNEVIRADKAARSLVDLTLGERPVSPKKALWCSTRTCEIGLEGIVSKREGSFYWSGRSRNWLESQEPEFRQDVTAMHRDAISLGGPRLKDARCG
jgi:hypothetical protein